jgi:hypothetical protein
MCTDPVEGYKDLKGMVEQLDTALQQTAAASSQPIAIAKISNHSATEDPLRAGTFPPPCTSADHPCTWKLMNVRILDRADHERYSFGCAAIEKKLL